MIPRILLLSVAFMIVAGDLPAQEVIPKELHRKSIKAYPYVYYTPETQLAFGVGGIATFYTGKDSVLRPSSVSLSGYYTSNGQWKIGFTPKLYFSENKRYLSAPASFGHYESKFWGIGNDTPDSEGAAYLEDVADIRLEFQWPPLFPVFSRSGAIYQFADNDIVDPKDNPLLLSGSAPGAEGGRLSGVGFTLVSDSRNETFYPTDGRYYTLSLLYYGDFIGSDFEFAHLTVDMREYLAAWGEWGAVAIQFYGEFASGSPPFYKYPAMGGASRMRGFFYGRYRDKTFMMAQAEYRRHIWWKLGAVLFLGFGQVSPDLSSYRIDSFHTSWGIGLRYLFNPEEHVNIRVDYGNGRNDSTTGIYFGVEEAF